jgi:outer membrane immunogenic protein
MKKLLLSAAVTALGIVSASAADLPARVYTKAPAIVAPATYNWTGFYLGVEGGGGWADTQHTNANNGINSSTRSIDGGLVGGTYGYNLQINSWVVGIEGDFSWSGLKSTFTDAGNGFCPVGQECVTELKWLGTDRARIGYAWDKLLVYGTVGIAYGEVRGTLLNAGFTSGSNTRTGLTYGGGVELGLTPNWSVKAEYLHVDKLGDPVTYNSIVGGSPERVSLKGLDIVRAGLNYRFNWGGPAY